LTDHRRGWPVDIPVPVKHLVLAPAERADVIVDFTKFARHL
jgi:hypothetical protein